MLQFQYFRNDLSEIDISSQQTKYEVFYLEGPFEVLDPVSPPSMNTRIVVNAVQSSNGSSILDTYTYFVSDTSNNTLGVLQYSFNYEQSGGGSVTFIPELEGKVSFACGIFQCYRQGSVVQHYNNTDPGKPRRITIYMPEVLRMD